MNVKQFYRYVFVFLLPVFIFSGCGSSNSGGEFVVEDTTSPTIQKVDLGTPQIVTISSASMSKIGIEWLPSSPSKASIVYEVHVSKTKAFKPTKSTLKATTTKDNYEVDGLSSNTLYYVMVVATAKNAKSNADSSQLSVKTTSVEPKLKKNINLLKQKDNEVKSVTDSNVTLSSVVKKGDFIVNAKHNYLRKVIDVKAQNGEYVVKTEKSTLGKIFSDVEFGLALKLEDTSKNNVASKSSYQKISNSKLLQNSSYIWNSGLSMKTEHFVSNKKKIKTNSIQKQTISKDKVEESNDYFKVSIPASMSVDVGEELKQKIDITQLKSTMTYDPWFVKKKDCDEVGGTYTETGDNRCLNTPIKICSVELSSIDAPGNLSNSGHRMEIRNNNILYWSPTENNVDRDKHDPYKVDVKVFVGVGDCQGDKKKAGGKFTLDGIKLTASKELPSSIPISKKLKFENKDKSITFKNTFTADFSPQILFSGKFLDDDLDTAKATIVANLSLEDIAELKISLQKKKKFTPKALYRKSFIKVVQMGPVPVVFSGELKFMAVADVNANAEIDTSLDMKTGLNLEYGMEYKNDNWSVLKPKKEITYSFTAGAKGDAGAKITVRVIPDFSVEVYKLAAAQLLVEPYVYSNIGIHGEVTAQIASTNGYKKDSSAEFTKLNAGIGLDLKVYAGAAWDTSLKFLKWPSKATYANSIDFNFMGVNSPKYEKNMGKYYKATDSYKKYTILKETNVTSIPTLDMVFDYSEIPPKGIDSRAIKIKGSYENIESPLYKALKLGKPYYIEFDKWDNPISVLSNAKIVEANKVGEYWLIPEILNDGKMEETKVKLVAHSNLGSWARQTTNKSLLLTQVATSNNKYVPQYWIDKYLNGSFDENGDKDGDNYSNLLEYMNGTSPDNSKDYPENIQPDIINNNTPPTANAGEDKLNISVGAEVHLSGKDSNDTDGDALTYLWSFVSIPNGSSTTFSDDTIVNPTFTADENGTYTIQLVVNDGFVSSSPDTVVIQTDEEAPTTEVNPTSCTPEFD